MFSFILAIIIAVSAITPCYSIDNGFDDTNCLAGHDQKKSGNCSPFFSCETSSGYVVETFRSA